MFAPSNTYWHVSAAILLFTLIGSFEPTAQAQNSGNDPVLEQVEPKFTCMINDKFFEDIQIPVHVGDKIYYGCCQMCVTALNERPESRFAIDPVSRDTVDKAKAVIGADSERHIYYFESEENLKTFDPDAHGQDDENGQNG